MSADPSADVRPLVVLKASLAKWLAILVFSTLASLGGVLMIGDGRMSGWLVTAFFALCAITAGASLVRRGRLEVTPRGITVVQFGRRQPALEWRYCSNFRAWSSGRGAGLVVFDYAGPEKRWSGSLAKASKAMAGANAALPDTYGMRAEELADLLDEQRKRWT